MNDDKVGVAAVLRHRITGLVGLIALTKGDLSKAANSWEFTRRQRRVRELEARLVLMKHELFEMTND